MSYLDQMFRSIMLTKFFTKGWGSPHDLKRIFDFRKIISNRETCQHLVDPDYPVFIDKEETHKQTKIIEGHFVSPLVNHMTGIMPVEVQTARFQMILPNNWQDTRSLWGNQLKPVVIHLGGTGDHGFGRRRKLMARPLLKESGIASIILENPYYGCRKPKKQVSCLQNVSDLFVMGGALVLESLVLLHWCERQGYGPLGMTGISMGGHMASLAASNWPKPLSLIPCLSWSTASTVFTRGVMSGAVDWKLLQKQFSKEKVYEDELSKMICSPEQNNDNHAFQLGVEFAKNFPNNIDDLTLYQEKDLYHDEVNNSNSGKYIKSKNKHYEGSFANKSSNSENSKHYHTSVPLMCTTNNGKNNISSNSSKSFLKRLKFSKDNKIVDQNTLDFMRGVMDECTHLGNFSVPVDPSLVIIVTAKDDAYIPRDTVMSLKDMWPDAKVRFVNSGHVAAFLTKQGEFRKAIIDSFDSQVKKYYC